MKFRLRRPCKTCPFLPLAEPPPDEKELAGMHEGTTNHHHTMTCHRTKHHRSEEHCAGAILVWVRRGQMSHAMRAAANRGEFDPTRVCVVPLRAAFMEDDTEKEDMMVL